MNKDTRDNSKAVCLDIDTPFAPTVRGRLESAETEIQDLKKQLTSAREVIEFYGDKGGYEIIGGGVARKWLKENK